MVAACQRTSTGSSGQVSAALAAPSARPDVGAVSATDRSSDAASSTPGRSPKSRVSAATEPLRRASRATSGEARSQIDGIARSTICGAKFPYSAVVTAAGASPSGADRPAK